MRWKLIFKLWAHIPRIGCVPLRAVGPLGGLATRCGGGAKRLGRSLALYLAAGLGACAALPPALPESAPAPLFWNAPLPADVAQINDVAVVPDWRAWWQGQSPKLLQWIEAAQTHSPNLALALVRVRSARAELTTAHNALLPSVSASASVSRARAIAPSTGGLGPALDSHSVGLNVSWVLNVLQLDLGRQQAQAAFEGHIAAWHAARSLVAAEVGRLYYANISCVQLAELQTEERRSHQETVRIQEALTRAGLAPQEALSFAQAALAASEGRERDTLSRCAQTQKALATLTALPQAQMVPAPVDVQQAEQGRVAIALPELPARLLLQRPDVQQATMRMVEAASAVGLARADLLPSLRLAGSFTRSGAGQGFSLGADLNTWSVGPLHLTLPLFNRSGLHAVVDVRLAQWEAAQKNWSHTLRTAIQEVESSLVSLEALQQRWRLANAAEQAHSQMSSAVIERARAGLASPVAREEATRARIAARQQRWVLLQNVHESQIQLYVALGAGYAAHSAAPQGLDLERRNNL